LWHLSTEEVLVVYHECAAERKEPFRFDPALAVAVEVMGETLVNNGWFVPLKRTNKTKYRGSSLRSE
jgi:hypothetical protein